MTTTNAIQDVYPLSPLQEGLLYQSLSDSSSAYIVQTIYRMDARFDERLVAESLRRLFARHDLLRTAFVYEGVQRLMQVVLHERTPEFRCIDLPADTDPDSALNDFLATDRARRFDLRKDVLMRLALLRHGGKSILVWSYHHILMDGGCTPVLVDEFNRIYTDLASGVEIELPKPAPYRRYIEWLEKQDRKASAAFWRSYLEGFEGNVPLFGREATRHPGGQAEALCAFTNEETAALRAAALKQRVTFNNYLSTVWGLLLTLYANRRDAVFGTVSMVRPVEVEGIDRMVGLFINTTPWRLRYEAGDTFETLVQAQGRQRSKSLAHQYFPLADIQSATPLGNRLFDHLFVISSELGLPASANGEAHAQMPVSDVRSIEEVNYPFSVHAGVGAALRVHFTYRTGVMDKDWVESLALHFRRLLLTVSQTPSVLLGQINLLDDAEQAELLALGEGPARMYTGTMIDHFQQAVRAAGSRTAVICRTGNLTYEELDRRSTVLALELENRGLRTGDVAGVLAQRQSAWIVALIAIWKAGGIYLPLDPAHPDARLQHQIEDSSCRLLLTDEGEGTRLSHLPVPRLSLHHRSASPIFTAGSSYRGCAPEQTAYIIYTSGTTGRPKGVPITQASLLETIVWHNEYFSMKEGEGVLQFASCGFDASLVEIFMALLSGGRLALMPDAIKNNTAHYTQFLQEHEVRLAIIPPAYMRLLNTEDLPGLTKIISTGEEAVWDRMLELGRERLVCNGYGPTETCVGACFHRIQPQYADDYRASRSIPVGRPFANKRVLLLDADGRLLPKGAAGEVCIGGIGLSPGYIGQDALTAEKFIDDRYHPGQRLYRTGDRGRWNGEGELLFEGRYDNQVQFHGIRIELGEIESTFMRFPGIQKACVRLFQRDNEPFIGAYFQADAAIDEQQLSLHLHRQLPAHMVPGWRRQVNHFSTTPNGKIDTAALPPPDDFSAAYKAPQTTTETTLCRLFARVLERETTGAADNFFLTGGHSIRGIKLLTLIEKTFDLAIPLKQLFEHPTPELLARYIDACLWARQALQPADDTESVVI